jgi:hypothetical protein
MYAIGQSAEKGFGIIPAVVVPVAVGALSHLGPSSGSLAEKAVPDVVASANSGNLVAVQVIDFKRGLTSGVVASERAVWQNAWGQIAPNVMQAYTQYKSILPNIVYPGSGLDNLTSSVQFALTHTITIPAAQAAATGGPALQPPGAGGVLGSPHQPGAGAGGGFAESGVLSALFSPLGIGISLALFLLTRKRGRR